MTPDMTHAEYFAYLNRRLNMTTLLQEMGITPKHAVDDGVPAAHGHPGLCCCWDQHCESDACNVNAALFPRRDDTVPTPAQWRTRFLDASPGKQMDMAAHVIDDANRASECFIRNHEKRIAELEDALARERRGREGRVVTCPRCKRDLTSDPTARPDGDHLVLRCGWKWCSQVNA